MPNPFHARILPAPRAGGFCLNDHWVWCGSAIREDDGHYHLFASRWPKVLPFRRGYILTSEVVRAVADRPTGPYHLAEVVLPARGADYWDGRMTHNPTIVRVENRFALFYIGSTFDGHLPDPHPLREIDPPALSDRLPQLSTSYNRIQIGLATAPTPAGPWQRSATPVLSPRPGGWDHQLVTNPAPCVLPDGRIRLYYRANTPQGLRLGVAEAAALDAPFRRLQDDPLDFCDAGHYVEDPFVWSVEDHYEMIAKDMKGSFTGEPHAGIHATSPDGLHWTPSNPAKAYSRTVEWDDGTTTVQGCLERPQLLFEHGRPTHLFAATADGPGGFDRAQNTWTMVLPLTPN